VIRQTGLAAHMKNIRNKLIVLNAESERRPRHK
jgi:hypothetical protein